MQFHSRRSVPVFIHAILLILFIWVLKAKHHTASIVMNELYKINILVQCYLDKAPHTQ